MKSRAVSIWPAGAATAMAMSTSVIAAPLTPSGTWQLEYADNQCTLSRSFDTGKNAVNLTITRGSSFNDLDFNIEGETLPEASKKIDLKISAQPGGQTAETSVWPRLKRAGGKEITQYMWSDDDGTFSKSIGDDVSLAVEYNKKDSVELKFSGWHKALAALQTCHDDLLKNVYGLDVAAVRNLQAGPQPEGNAAMWVTHTDYPSEALRAKWEGTTQILVIVDERGKVAGCRTIVSSGHAVLDQRACEMTTRRGSFKPAIDKEGKAVTAPWNRFVRWRVPK